MTQPPATTPPPDSTRRRVTSRRPSTTYRSSPQPTDGSAHAQGMSEGLRVISYLLGGLAFYGGLGWLGDRHFDTVWMLPTGMVLGMAGAVYLIIRRYGQTETPTDQSGPSAKTKDTN